MLLDDSFSNVSIRTRLGVDSAHIRQIMQIPHRDYSHSPFPFPGTFLSEPRDRRFLSEGFELSIHSDSHSWNFSLFSIVNGAIDTALVNLQVNQQVLFPRYVFLHAPSFSGWLESNNQSPYSVILCVIQNDHSVRRVVLYKQLIRNVLFDAASIELKHTAPV